MLTYTIQLDPAAELPAKANSDDTGYDLVALTDPEFVGESAPNGGWKRLDYIQYRTGIRIGSPSNQICLPNPGTLTLKYVEHIRYWTLLFPRSSVSKYNLLLANSVGVIDHGYTGELMLRFKYVWQPEDYVVDGTGLAGTVNLTKIYHKGEKIGQIVPVKLEENISFAGVAEVGGTTRGAGGFGSSDHKNS